MAQKVIYESVTAKTGPAKLEDNKMPGRGSRATFQLNWVSGQHWLCWLIRADFEGIDSTTFLPNPPSVAATPDVRKPPDRVTKQPNKHPRK